MAAPELQVEIRSSGQEYTLYLNGQALTRSFSNPEEAHTEFERFTSLIDAARREALKAFAGEYGIFERPRTVLVADPRKG